MKGVFIGTDSMGYENGETYYLRTWLDKGFIWLVDVDGHCTPCPYSSLITLIENWNIINDSQMCNDEIGYSEWADF